MFALASVAVTTNVKAASLPRGSAIGALALGAVWGIYKYFYSAETPLAETPLQKKLNQASKMAELEYAKKPALIDKVRKTVSFNESKPQMRLIPSIAELIADFEEQGKKEKLELERMRLHDPKGEMVIMEVGAVVDKKSERRGPPLRSTKKAGFSFRT